MSKVELPSWLKTNEYYQPVSDNDSFLRKTILRIAKSLENFYLSGNYRPSYREGILPKMVITFLFILCISVTSQKVVIQFGLAWELVRLIFLPTYYIRYILKISILTSLVNLVILLPSVIFFHNSLYWWIPLKLFISITMIQIFILTTSWHDVIGALRILRVPSFFIFILHITLQYIFSLCRLTLTLLEALYLRSVGKNQEKNKYLSGVGGTLFIRVQEKMQLLYEAMLCRGFAGQYYIMTTGKKQIYWIDYLSLLLIVVMMFFTFIF